MRQLATLLIAAAVVVVAAAAPSVAANRTIAITATGFVPRDVTVNVGDTVTWSNTDTRPHQVVVDRTTCSFTIQPGGTASCPFRTTGRFSYREPAVRGNQWRGTVIVRAAAASLSIAARPLLVTYGGASTLSGVLSTSQANERVTVQSKACRASSFSTLAAVNTTTGGAWTLAVRPLEHTLYQARWRQTASGQVMVRVKPRVTLRKLTRGRFMVRVAAAQTFGGKVVVLQRFVPSRAAWTRVRFIVLKVVSTGSPTIVSGATVRARVRAGTRVRAVIGQAQVGACYAAGVSNVVRR